jgi:hypothetical protein
VMSNRRTKIIDGAVQIVPFMQSLFDVLTKAIETGSVAVDVYRPEEARNNEQNKKGWALWNDISQQIEWYGNKLSPEHWKELLSADWKAQTLVPGISGGFCALGVRTSKLNKREFSELIEITYAFGSSHGVVWSEPALKAYTEYRESSQ